MKLRLPLILLAGAAGLALSSGGAAAQQYSPAAMTFFVTSIGSGEGGNLGGLEGADAHCQELAEAVGAGGMTWVAYLSTLADGNTPAINARDRVGPGPWQNAFGVVVAANLEELHGTNAISKETAVNERGEVVNGRGDQPNMHDMLTGTLQDGTAADATCGNWTSSSDTDRTYVGHHDLIGNNAGINFWNYSHASRGCSQQGLVATGGAGLFYCFAVIEP